MSVFPLRIAIIGCGRISQSYLQATRKCSSVSLHAAVDLRREAADALGESADCAVFYDLESCLESKEIDAAIVCTPPNTHKKISCRLLEAGKHVLCEKPLATNLEDGLTMMAAARKYKKHLMMASKFRYVEDLVSMKSLIASGKLGRPLYFENTFSGKIDLSQRWNADLEISGGGVLIDNGSHSVDISRYLLGPIRSVRARNLTLDPTKAYEDTVELALITTAGLPGMIYLTWNFSLDRDGYVSFYGTEGRARANWHKSEYQLYPNDQKSWVSFGKGYDKMQAFADKMDNFAQTISGRAKPLISEIDSLASVAVIEAAYKSLKSEKWEDVAQEYR